VKVGVVMYGGASSLSFGGGAERRFARVVEYLVSQGHEIYLYVNKQLEDEIISLIGPNIKQNIISYDDKKGTKLEILKFNAWLLKQISNNDIDIIHLPLIQKSLIPFYKYLVFKKIPFVVTVALYYFSTADKLNFMTKNIGKYLFKHAHSIDSLYESFVYSKFGIKHKNKINVSACSFTDYQRFTPKEKKKIITFCGRLIESKNPMLFLKAIKNLKEKLRSGWEFHLLGGGELKSSLEDYVIKNKLEEYVLIYNTSRTEEVLSKSMIFCSLQKNENYPSQSLLEAMSCENAIIATNVGETNKLVNSSNGVLINGVVSELTDSFELLMKDNDLRTNLATKAREMCQKKHRVEIFSDYLLNIWTDLYGSYKK
jgi:glycosyltransferase involved in cell wall biosynthesis